MKNGKNCLSSLRFDYQEKSKWCFLFVLCANKIIYKITGKGYTKSRKILLKCQGIISDSDVDAFENNFWGVHFLKKKNGQISARWWQRRTSGMFPGHRELAEHRRGLSASPARLSTCCVWEGGVCTGVSGPQIGTAPLHVLQKQPQKWERRLGKWKCPEVRDTTKNGVSKA